MMDPNQPIPDIPVQAAQQPFISPPPKPTHKFIFLLGGLVILFAGIFGGYYLVKSSSEPPGKACTLEAKICPDGSSVGRTGPNCEFAPCPQISTATAIPTNQNSAVRMLGSSMLPNFIDNTSYPVNRGYYQANDPKRGDVVLFTRQAANGPIEIIKRVIGLPGENLQLKDEKVFINGNILFEPYLAAGITTKISEGSFIKESQIINIPTDNYFVMGDNRDHSSDSREWGLVPKINILGKL